MNAEVIRILNQRIAEADARTDLLKNLLKRVIDEGGYHFVPMLSTWLWVIPEDLHWELVKESGKTYIDMIGSGTEDFKRDSKRWKKLLRRVLKAYHEGIGSPLEFDEWIRAMDRTYDWELAKELRE